MVPNADFVGLLVVGGVPTRFTDTLLLPVGRRFNLGRWRGPSRTPRFWAICMVRLSRFSSRLKHPARGLIKPTKQLRRRWRVRLLNCRAALRRLTLRHVTFIAVTGSCGKTTAIALADAVLSSAGKCWTGVGSSRWLVAETLLSVPASTRFCLQELHASLPGLIGESLSFLQPKIGVVTTVGGDHYKSYRSLEATAREKGQLVESLPRSGIAILNADDSHVLSMAERARGRVMTFGLSPQADLRAMEVSSVWPERLSMKVVHQREAVSVETQLVGEHWVTSVLAAIAAGIAWGVDLKTCAEAVRTVEPVFGRYSVHMRSDGAAYVLDTHKAPLWSIAQGLAFVRAARAPRKTMVFGTISDYPGANSPRYRRVAREALEVADRVIFVGPQSSHVDKLRHPRVDHRGIVLRRGFFSFRSATNAPEALGGAAPARDGHWAL